MDIPAYNRAAWNQQSSSGTSRWCQPVSVAEIQAARAGRWSLMLTPNKPVPQAWLGDVAGKKVLCLASGGGQQAPLLAAAGAVVTSFDNSEEQLAKDRLVADRDGLTLDTVRGDMADLSVFADGSFDLIFHAVSNVFAENLAPVWRECHRVLRPGGRLIAGFMNPLHFLFDHEEAEQTGVLQVRHALPYSDLTSRSPEWLAKTTQENVAYEFGHTLEQQIGGQFAAGFLLAGLYEDGWDDTATPLNKFTTMFIATLALKIETPSTPSP
ncbi:MAG: class I SAM-dependent methyltransferase [Prosthecobacter sp.]